MLDKMSEQTPEAETPPAAEYENPEFLSPNDLATMMSERGRNPQFNVKDAMIEAAIVAALCFDDAEFAEVVAEATRQSGVKPNFLLSSRRRLRERIEMQERLAAVDAAQTL